MRLGAHKVILDKETIPYGLYKSDIVSERHRHRYEVNPTYIERLEKAGLRFVGKSEDGVRMEVFQLKDHPYYVGCQFHPELKSRPRRPAPLFAGLVGAAVEYKHKSA